MRDLSATDVATVLELAERPDLPQVLAGKGAGLVFEHPSARTRNAAEMAVYQLGGHPVVLRGEEVGLGRRESGEDVARTLACYHALIGARVADHETLEQMAAALDAADLDAPVLNLLSNREHPTQALADLLTIRQRLGHLQGRSIAYVGDANNVCRSLAYGAFLTGMHLAVASPPAYGLGKAELSGFGGLVRWSDQAEEAVEGVEVVYTDVWVSMGEEADADAKRAALAGFCLDEALLARAAPGALVMHCLPAHRGEEITAAVIDGPQSIVWQQAANRLHAMRGLVAFMLGVTGT